MERRLKCLRGKAEKYDSVREKIERSTETENSNRKMKSGLYGIFMVQAEFTEKTRGVNRGFFQYLVYIKSKSP